MPKVVVQKNSKKTAADTFSKVKSILMDDKDLKKLDPSYKCQFNEGDFTGSATGKMFNATMSVKSSGSTCDVEIIVELPFALSLAKGLVKKTLEKKLDESLA